ncbi:hypothetical protein CBR_g40561 [Chara braunii]|uniref:G domain-containing protein n=1 Tax=Chara braunii TaxID=69332 RepID=A0A388K2D5_CHABU|nr:hypothetical protein CBR_g40561 [Chara braunii]|eukprot:GBG64113.1 hypothetical protein CBR_g40561 [Chara braunii]
MGLAGHYQRFIGRYARIAAPLSKLQSLKVPFHFTDKVRSSFQRLNTVLLLVFVSSIYDPTLSMRVTTYAFGYDIGAISEQHGGVDWHPVEYFSQKVPPINLVDDVWKEELLVFVTVLKRSRHFLLGRHRFTSATDNNPLTYYKTQDTMGFGIQQLADDLKAMAGPRGDVWVIGCQNAGKSSLINALGRVNSSETYVSALTEAAVPGTTIGVLEIDGVLSGRARLYDTPGLLHPHQAPRPVMRQPQFAVVPPAGAGPSTMPRPTGQTFSPMFGMPPPGGLAATSGPVQRVSTVPSTTVVTTVPLSSQAQVSVQQPVSVAMQPLQQAPEPMQPMQWMPKIPLMSPKPFYGDRKEEEDLDTWVRTMPTYVRHKLTRPEQEVVVAASFLEGSATRWLNGLVQQQGYGQDFDAWAQAQTLEQFVRSVYNRWHDPQGPQKATDAINNLCSRRFKDVRELTDTVERLLVVPGVRFDQEVLLTDYLRCLPAEVRTKLVDEAYVEQHTFTSFSKKALDIEAKLGSAHKASHDGRKRLPQDWKKKGQLMFVDHDGQSTEIDDFPYLGELTEHDGAIETSDG